MIKNSGRTGFNIGSIDMLGVRKSFVIVVALGLITAIPSIGLSEILGGNNSRNSGAPAAVATAPVVKEKSGYQLQCWQAGTLVINEKGLVPPTGKELGGKPGAVIEMTRVRDNQAVRVIAPMEGTVCLLKRSD
jgi:hypothetical protein